MSAFIVAEAGCNHLGDRAKMLAFCDAAKACGADSVKFQAFDAWKLAQRRGWNDREQIKHEHRETFKLLQRAELSDADLDAISAHCKAIGLKWGASVFDTTQAARVMNRGAFFLKIGHKEADWSELLESCTAFSCCVFVSNPPWVWIDEPSVGRIWCIAEYPATSKPQLGKLDERQHQKYHGFSSHYTDWRIPAAAGARGIGYLEAHLKLSDDDPEAAWSLSVEDFGKMVKQVREYESWL